MVVPWVPGGLGEVGVGVGPVVCCRVRVAGPLLVLRQVLDMRCFYFLWVFWMFWVLVGGIGAMRVGGWSVDRGGGYSSTNK